MKGSDKPSLERAIRWGKNYELVKSKPWSGKMIRRLVEATEKWLESQRGNMSIVNTEWLEELQERSDYIFKHTNYDNLLADKDRRIEELEKRATKEFDRAAYHAEVSLALRSQLTEKKRELERLREENDSLPELEAQIDELYETFNRCNKFLVQRIQKLEEAGKKPVCAPTEAWAYSPTFIAKLKKVLKSVDKGDYKSFETMEGVIEHLEKRAKPTQPTEAEVEKVAEVLENHTPYSLTHDKEYTENLKHIARHVLTRGYRLEG